MSNVTDSVEGFASITIHVPKSMKDRLVELVKKLSEEQGREVTMKEIMITDLQKTLKKFGY